MNSASGAHSNLEKDCQIIKDGESLTIRRREDGKFERGKWISSNRFEEFEDVSVSFQPLSGRERLQLPEGDRKRSHIKMYTEFQVKVDDIIERNGEDYEVQIVDDWGTFTKSIARLVDVKRR